MASIQALVVMMKPFQRIPMSQRTSLYLNYVVVNAMNFVLSLSVLFLFYKIGARQHSGEKEKDKMSALISSI